MKKIYFLISFILAVLTSTAQLYPTPYTQQGSPSTMVQARGGLKSDSTFLPPAFADSTAANLTRAKLYGGSLIFSIADNGYLQRNKSATKWLRVSGCGVLQGGVVSYSGTGLTFNISAAPNYCINNMAYASLGGSVTLTTANPSLPRIDVIFLDTLGQAGKITGTAATNPAVPQIDPLSQYFLTSILVPAASTSPGGIVQTIIYDENTEWTSSSALNAGTVSFVSTNTPFHLTKNAVVTGGTSGTLKWTNGSAVNTGNYSNVTLYIKLDIASPTCILGANLLLGGSIVNIATIDLSLYGFNPNISGSYQTLIVPMTAFGNAVNFDAFQLKLGGVAGAALHVDYINLQSGVTPPSGQLWSKTGNSLYPTVFLSDSVAIGKSIATNKLDVAGGANIGGTLYLQDGSDDATIGTPGGTFATYKDNTGDFLYGNDVLGIHGRNVWINHAKTAATADSIWAAVGDTLTKIPFSGGGGSGTDSASFHTTTQLSDTSFSLNRPNGTKDTISFSFGGGGTVTNVTSGDLSPLFTTSVVTPTTTPAFSFSLTNAGAHTLFGRASSTGTPSYLTSIDSTFIPTLHSEAYFNTKYAAAGASNVWLRASGKVYLNTSTDTVGIGTSTPTSKLTVAGNILGTNNIRAKGLNDGTMSGAGTGIDYRTDLDYGRVQAYNATTSTFKPLLLSASEVVIGGDPPGNGYLFNIIGSQVAKYTSSGNLSLNYEAASGMAAQHSFTEGGTDRFLFGYVGQVSAFRIFNQTINGNTLVVPNSSNNVIINNAASSDDGVNKLQVTGSLGLKTAGSKINIATGTNASVGTATLASGTVTVSTTAVTASSKIFLTDATTGSLTNIGTVTVGTITAGTSFVINSTNVLDSGNVNWFIIN